ncbi:MAG: hypothetical protein H0T87_11905 [Gammaproteobacteria bacterium]|nr:hypothetical protein [Gammaproteobacteria bacterium]
MDQLRIPDQSDHRFRRKLITHSGSDRITAPERFPIRMVKRRLIRGLTEDLDAGEVLMRGEVATQFTYLVT